MIDFEKIREEKIKNIQFIAQTICKITNTYYNLIQSRCKNEELNTIRHLIWKYVKDTTDYSLKLIGEAVGDRNHPTVSSGIKVFINDLEKDKRAIHKSIIDNNKITLKQYYDEVIEEVDKFKEIWVNINKYYQISNTGKARSLSRLIQNSERYVRRQKGQPMSLINDKYGYPFFEIRENYKRKKIYIHREVAKAFVSNVYNLNRVAHIDGNKLNNHYTNLLLHYSIQV